MAMRLDQVKQEVRRIALKVENKGILAAGLFGSLARGDFDERSDIDIFVITEQELPLEEQDELYNAFSEVIPKFDRDVTVLVYDLNGLKRVPTWQTLNLVKDACLVYDRAGLANTFELILQQAEKHGIVYDEQERIFRLKRPARVIFSVE
jgi:predicted nucleotidyltransferase